MKKKETGAGTSGTWSPVVSFEEPPPAGYWIGGQFIAVVDNFECYRAYPWTPAEFARPRIFAYRRARGRHRHRQLAARLAFSTTQESAYRLSPTKRRVAEWCFAYLALTS